MALPAGRYGVTKNQLLKIKKLPMNTIKLIDEKCDNSVIAPVENGSTASQAYAVGEHFIRDGAFCTCKQAISQGGSFTLNTNYTAGDVASCLVKQATFSGTTSSIGALIVSTSQTRVIISAEVVGCVVDLYKRSEGYGAVVKTPQGEPVIETAVSGTYYYI